MKWKKSPPELIEKFEQLLPQHPLITKRKMFGYPCGFAKGKLFIGLHQDNMVLRLSAEDREKFMTKYKAKIFSPMPGRTMKEYVVVPATLFSKKAELNRWIEKAFEYVIHV